MEIARSGISWPGLDPQVQQALDRLGTGPYHDLDAMPLAEALTYARPAMPAKPPPADSRDRMIPGLDGTPLRLRLYGAEGRGALRPVLLHLHGGGFVGGSIELDDARCAYLAADTDCIVASLDYRLAPEFRFPTAVEDAYAAWEYLTREAIGFGGDPANCAISGSSAGGHLAIGLSLLARRRGARLPRFQILTYPVIDPEMNAQSYGDFAHGPFLTRARMAWYWKQYAAAQRSDNTLWNPLRANPTGWPPTLVMTAEYDVLRDEGESFAARLHEAGVRTRVRRYPGMIHGFIAVLPLHPQTQTALREVTQFLTEHFAAT